MFNIIYSNNLCRLSIDRKGEILYNNDKIVNLDILLDIQMKKVYNISLEDGYYSLAIL
ncbi:hypothetical protein CUS_7028 [Ruminococcus albus 8]|uniref:Uncharacterized protein n=1 Tax=Ruminococcus albus 8 TaxID=246199 RepID=E9SHS8_RUMAL|nr:hypothetical protein CUS_7028 [Ruminococcus albus 8]